jgi:hypothetical protein
MILVSLHLRLKMMIHSVLMRARLLIQAPLSMTASSPHRHPLAHPRAHLPTLAVPVRATNLAHLSPNLLPLILTKNGRKWPIHSIYF